VIRWVIPVLALSVIFVACAPVTTDATVPDTLTTTSSTTVPETTTTTGVESTTTTTAGTTTTGVESTTTTVAEGVVELDWAGVQAGPTWVWLGMVEADAIDAVSTTLGSPTHDSGWIDSFSPYGACPGATVRGVHWGDFVMLFTEAETDFWSPGVPHFFSYYYTGTTPTLTTVDGIAIGSTLAQLETTYGGPDLVIDEDPFNPSGGFWTYRLASWTGLWGYATGQSDADTVSSINGGRGCGE
jgi:hypothetical protein